MGTSRFSAARGIERRCRDDIAFRVITANEVPDHATVARFRVRHESALGELFGQVLGLCVRAGLVDVGVVAVDGTKLAAMARERSVRSYEEIAKEILDEAGRIDADEDERFGERGDELPGELATRHGRQAWLRDALRELEQERARAAEPIPVIARRAWRSATAGWSPTGAANCRPTVTMRRGGRVG